jgi:DNA polymerase elongation subunit (family B)
MNHNFVIANGDTDSIAFKKPDQTPFTPEEQDALLAELNAQMPANIVWKNDKHYRRLIVFKAKNYVMDDGKKVKIKGSALKGGKKEPALKDFTREVIDLLLKDRKEQVIFLYLQKVYEINALADITPWCFKVTVTKKVLDPQATFQKKIRAAIGSRPVSEGDKVYLFFKEDESLCLRENFAGDFDKKVLLGKLRDTLEVFGNVFDVELFPDLTLKRNADLLATLAPPVAQPRTNYELMTAPGAMIPKTFPLPGVKMTRI